MRTRVQDLIRSSRVPKKWASTRHRRDRTAGKIRGVVRGPIADSTGWGFRVGRNVFLGVHPQGHLVVGDQVTLYDHVRLNVESADATLSIGNGAYLNYGTQVFCRSAVVIGEGCAIGFGCLITDTDFHVLDGNRANAAVVIGKNVWLGANVTVLKGVTIGEGCVVAAGSVVTRGLPPYTLAAGVPAAAKRSVAWAP